jgi:hypothetical protein
MLQHLRQLHKGWCSRQLLQVTTLQVQQLLLQLQTETMMVLVVALMPVHHPLKQ